MASRHLRTLTAVFEDPVRANILWSDIESMLRYLGARIEQGSGSRVWITRGTHRLVLHRPHPRKEIPPRAVRALRKFLSASGAKP